MEGKRLSLPNLEVEARTAGLPARHTLLDGAPAGGLSALQERYPEVGTIRVSTKLVRDGVEWVLAVTDSETHAFSSDGRHNRIRRVPDYGTLVDPESGMVILADDSVISSGFAGFHREITVWNFLEGSRFVLQLRPPDIAAAK